MNYNISLCYYLFVIKIYKKIKTSDNEIEIKIPRDRNSEFEPQIIEKYQRDISDL